MKKKNIWIAELLVALALFYLTDKSLPAVILLFVVGIFNAADAAHELIKENKR